MPLVTRQADRGQVFNTPTEPPNWLDGDLWSDTTANILKLNDGGTAEDVGLDVDAIHTWGALQTFGAGVTITPGQVLTQNLLESGKIEFLGEHTNTTEETDFVFTPTTPVDFNNYSAVICYWSYDLDATGTAFDLNLQLDNDDTGNYHETGFTQVTTTLTGFQNLSGTNWTISNTGQSSGNSNIMWGYFILTSHTGFPQIFVKSTSSTRNELNFNGQKAEDLGTITTFDFDSSTAGGWENSKFQFYGVRRAA